MNLDNLRAFILFAEHLNFTHAARELNLTQPALHSKVKSLSRELKVKLYEKVGRQLIITEHGLRVLAFGRELKEQCETFYEELHGLVRKEPIVLAAGEGAYLYILANKLKSHLNRAGVPLRLLTRDSEATVKAVLTGEAHLGVAVQQTIPKGIDAHPLGTYPYRVAMDKKHPLARKKKVCLNDLHGVGLIVPQEGRPFRTFLESQLKRVGAHLEVVVETKGWNLCLHFVQLGIGAAIINGCCHLPKGVVAKELPELGGITYYAISRAGAKSASPVAKLLKKLID